MRLRPGTTLILSASALLVLGLGLLLREPTFPLGVPGEWTWSRLGPKIEPVAVDVVLAMVGLLLFAGFAAMGWRRPEPGPAFPGAGGVLGSLACPGRRACAVGGDAGRSSGVRGAEGGHARRIRGSSGYYHVARSEMADPMAFLKSYPEWIRAQDVYHIGTHPPGLFLFTRASLGLMDAAPGLARAVDDGARVFLGDAFRQVAGPMSRADRTALALVALATMLACVGTSVPLYLLLRGSGADPSTSWSAAVLWLLVPSAILFQPTADTAFPFLAASAVALSTRRGPIVALLAGVVLAIGMTCSLVFLAVGLIVGLMHATAAQESIRRRTIRIVLTGAGFLLPTLLGWWISGANPFLIWWWNQANHAGFYGANPRSYGPWILVNAVELTVAIGLPASLWIGVALATHALLGPAGSPFLCWRS